MRQVFAIMHSLLGSYHIGILCFSAQALLGVLFGNDQLRRQDEESSYALVGTLDYPFRHPHPC